MGEWKLAFTLRPRAMAQAGPWIGRPLPGAMSALPPGRWQSSGHRPHISSDDKSSLLGSAYVRLCLHMEMTCSKQTPRGPAIRFISELSSQVSVYRRSSTRPWFSAVGVLVWALALNTVPPAHGCGSCQFLARTNTQSSSETLLTASSSDSQPAATVSPSCDCSLPRQRLQGFTASKLLSCMFLASRYTNLLLSHFNRPFFFF